MTVFWIVFTQMVALLLLTAIGWWLGRSKLVRETKQLSAVLTRVTTPALLVSMLQAEYSRELLRDLGATALGTLIMMIAGLVVGLLLALATRRKRRERWTWTVCVAFANTIFMGRPVMVALYGDAVDPMIAGISLMFNLVVFTLGAYLVSLSVIDAENRVDLRRILLSPIVIACFVGFALFLAPFRLPEAVSIALSSVGNMSTPLSMLLLGIELSFTDLRNIFLSPSSWLVNLFRLVVTPVVCYFAMRPFLHDPVVLGIVTVSAAMPIASSVTVLATEYDGDTAFATTATTLSNLLCVITAPIVLSLLLG